MRTERAGAWLRQGGTMHRIAAVAVPLALAALLAASASAQVKPDADGAFNAGLAHLKDGRPAVALEEFRKAVKVDPKNALYYKGLAVAYAQLADLCADEGCRQDKLKESIQLQITQIIYRLFRWKDAEYHFSQETTIEYDRDNVTPIAAESILMEGARMLDEWPIIEKRVRSYDMVFRKKLTDQEILVVGAEEADEIDFAFGAAAWRVIAGNKNVAQPSQIPVGKSFTANAGPLFASAIVSVNRIAPVAQTTTRFPADELVRECGEEWQGKLLSN